MKVGKLSLFLLFLILGACKMGPDYERPQVHLPEKWKNVGVTSESGKENVEWWTNFQDETLTKLIQLTMDQNFDLKAAQSSIQQNQEILNEAIANLLPLTTLSATVAEKQWSKNYLSFVSRKYSLYGVLPTISWEMDIFGKLQRAKEGASADLQAQLENSYGLFLSLVSNVAETYICLRSAQQRLEVTLKLIAAYKKIYKLILDLEKSGLASGINSDMAKSAWETHESFLYPLETSIKSYMYVLSSLTSQPPEALEDLLKSSQKIPQVSPALFLGLPSELLERRPDIRKAEMLLASATAQIGFRKADFFPSFNLTGTIGFESYKASNLISSGSVAYSIGPGFNWSIFDFGRVKAQVMAAEALKDQVYYTYRQKILNALAEVESSLVAYKNEFKKYEVLETSQRTIKNATRLTKDLYKAGLQSEIPYLQVQIELLNKTLHCLSSQEILALNAINLYKALGGGWEPYAQKILEKDSREI
jgi:NodT family efflux transporter outer membrane factor (OMF) lipoprotein